MKNLVKKLLAFYSRRVIKKYKPFIVAITGSVGKTSTKEAVNLVLSCKKRIKSSFSNYNNEFGLPLTIIGEKSGGKNIFSWLKVFWQAQKLILFKDKSYPEVLVLETGIDRVGDMDYLNSIFKPDRAILTNISHSHIEYFGSLEKIKKEKIKLLKNLKKNGVAIINFDNENVKNTKNELKNPVLTYGLKPGADVLAKDISFNLFLENKSDVSDAFIGANFKLEYKGSVVPVNLSNAISLPSVYSFLGAVSIALSMGFNLIDLIDCAKDFKNPKGRMGLIRGIKKTIIIDDTYNSSPESSLLAIDFLKSVKTKKDKIAVLGDMLELGHYSEEGHYLVGKKIASSGIKELVLLGEKSRDIARGAVDSGFNKDKIFHFMNVKEAGLFIQGRIEEGDIILVKASQGMRLEKIVKEIMDEPEKAKDLLVRQGAEWLDGSL